MGNSVQTERVIRFQDFQINLETGELWRAGVRLKLQDQPFKVLATLLERPGQIVPREELRQIIWPQESFGDFDHAINLAMTKLRATLGDSADVPHLIETLPRRGYRFIAPIEGQTQPQPELARAAKKRFERTKTTWGWVGAGSLAVALLCTFVLLRTNRKSVQSLPPEVIPLVTMEGKQSTPVFSPDGNQVAFVEYSSPHPGIYTAMATGGRPLQLTDNPADSSPTWSPDGREIAFVRLSEAGHQESFYVMPALGGPERRLYTGPAWAFDQCGRIEWSPDGKNIAFPGHSEDGSTSRITLLSLSDLTTRALSSPPRWIYDCEPTFSPDGSSIAFVRTTMGAFLGDVFLLKTAGGDAMRLTSGNSGGEPAWANDGNEIVFSSPMGGLRNLYRISVKGGTPQPVAGTAGIADAPSIAHKGSQLVYQQITRKDTVWRLGLKDERHALGPPMRLLSARGIVWKPSISPDGTKVAFESDRLGFTNLWVCEIDGSQCAQLTSMHRWTDNARWSPDGRYIAFEAILQDHYQVYVIEVQGGSPRLVPTFPDSTSGLPNWSRDGRWLYFYSRRGDSQVWKVPFKGGPPVQVTKNGGVYGTESYDGQFLYYSKAEPGVWRMPVGGGEETHILGKPSYWNDWALARGGIYYLNKDSQPNGRIEFFDFATRNVTPIFSPEKPVSEFGGVTLSPDGRLLLFGQNEFDESYIVLVKNFR